MKKKFINEVRLRELVDAGASQKEIAKEMGVCADRIWKEMKILGLKSKYQHKHTEEEKELMRQKRKKWLAENPDRHPWKRVDKFKSEPCEKVKEYLRELKIEFIPEYSPEINGRFFSVDIALPDKMIAIEINGNQHYERSGELKPYYKERHDLLVDAGWDVYEVHYSSCFNLGKWADFTSKIQNSEKKVDFDYFNYVPKKKRQFFCSCGTEIWRTSKRCKKCHLLSLERRGREVRQKKEQRKDSENPLPSLPPSKTKKEKSPSLCSCGDEKHPNAKECKSCHLIGRRVVSRPSKEELEALILEFPFTKLGEMFGVSDNAVRNWCKNYGIEKLPDSKYRREAFLKRQRNGASAPIRTETKPE